MPAPTLTPPTGIASDASSVTFSDPLVTYSSADTRYDGKVLELSSYRLVAPPLGHGTPFNDPSTPFNDPTVPFNGLEVTLRLTPPDELTLTPP